VTVAKKGHHFEGRRLKKVISFFEEENREIPTLVTPVTFLFQCLSIALQQGNVVSFQNTTTSEWICKCCHCSCYTLFINFYACGFLLASQKSNKNNKNDYIHNSGNVVLCFQITVLNYSENLEMLYTMSVSLSEEKYPK